MRVLGADINCLSRMDLRKARKGSRLTVLRVLRTTTRCSSLLGKFFEVRTLDVSVIPEGTRSLRERVGRRVEKRN